MGSSTFSYRSLWYGPLCVWIDIFGAIQWDSHLDKTFWTQHRMRFVFGTTFYKCFKKRPMTSWTLYIYLYMLEMCVCVCVGGGGWLYRVAHALTCTTKICGLFLEQ